MAYKYTKKVTLVTTGGNIEFNGTKADAVENRLNNDGRIWHFTDESDSKKENYYALDSTSAKFALIGFKETAKETVADDPCEDPLTSCAPEILSIAPATAATAGGDSIVLTLATVTANAIVLVDNAVVAGTVDTTAKTITFTAPAHAAGAVEVAVVDSGKQSDAVVLTYA